MRYEHISDRKIHDQDEFLYLDFISLFLIIMRHLVLQGMDKKVHQMKEHRVPYKK